MNPGAAFSAVIRRSIDFSGTPVDFVDKRARILEIVFSVDYRQLAILLFDYEV